MCFDSVLPVRKGALVPQVDFMILCDYVRADGGLLHMIAAGIDRIRVPMLPAVHNVGVAVRLSLHRSECDRDYELQLIFQNTDGQRIADLTAQFRAQYPPGLPAGWPTPVALALNLGLPLQAYGEYSFELLISGDHKKSLGVIVEPPPQGG